MNKSIILVAILLLVVAINLILIIRIRKRPNKIVGLGLDETVDEIEEGKVWRALLCRCITIGNVITLAGGGVSILFVSLSVPLGLLYAYGKRSKFDKSGSEQKSTTVVVVVAVVFLCELVAILAVSFQTSGDLDLTFNPNEFEIHGLFGTNIAYGDIKQINIQHSLPALKRRSNGFEARSTKLGNFVTSDDLRILLFAHSDSCFIRIVTKNNEVYYLSSRQPDKTKAIFGEIQKRI